MRKIEMAWEWSWPELCWHWHTVPMFEINWSISPNKPNADHTPAMFFTFFILGVKLLDFGYYNVHHAENNNEPS